MQVSKKLPAIQNVVNKLENQKWHIRLIHDPKHTRTTTMVIERGHRYVTKSQFIGTARCTRGDQFSRTTGTRIAFNRALHKMSAQLGREKVKEILS